MMFFMRILNAKKIAFNDLAEGQERFAKKCICNKLSFDEKACDNLGDILISNQQQTTLISIEPWENWPFLIEYSVFIADLLSGKLSM